MTGCRQEVSGESLRYYSDNKTPKVLTTAGAGALAECSSCSGCVRCLVMHI